MPGSTVSPWLLPRWASLPKAQFHQEISANVRLAASTRHSRLPAQKLYPAQAFFQSLRACLRSELRSSAVALTFHPVFESLQSLTFSTLPLAHHAKMMIHQLRRTSPYLLSCPPGRQNFSLLLQCQISHLWICLTS